MQNSKEQMNVIVSREDLTLPELQEQEGHISVIYSTSTIIVGKTDAKNLEFKVAGSGTYDQFSEIQSRIPEDVTVMGIVSFGKKGIPLVVYVPKPLH